jgi:hypothetical protein
VAAVVVDAARVIHRSFAERQVGDPRARRRHLEEMADALPRIAIVAADGFLEALGGDRHFHGGHEQRFANLHHSLRMVRGEPDRRGGHQTPGGLTGQAPHPVAEVGRR